MARKSRDATERRDDDPNGEKSSPDAHKTKGQPTDQTWPLESCEIKSQKMPLDAAAWPLVKSA